MERATNSTRLGSFKELIAWQKGDDLAAEIYTMTEDLHTRHRWLGLQLIKAATSVTANIAEGYGRSSLADYLRFLEFAGGSLNEVENFLHFAKRNKIVTAERIKVAEGLRSTTGNLLFGLSRSLRNRQRAGSPWQRGIKEESAQYTATSDETNFPFPISHFQSGSSQPDDFAPEPLQEEDRHG